ncbi:MAG: hypothetical protein Q9163_000037 [Psora crenata]
MSAQPLQTRLQSLFESLRQTQQLISRLSKLPSQPGAIESSPDKGNVRVELSSEIHQNLKDQEEEFELIRQEAEDQTSSSSWSSARGRLDREREKERERTDLAGQVARLGEDLKIAHNQFRRAQLIAKRNAEAAKRKERELLFAGIQEGVAPSTTGYGRRKGQEKLSEEEILLNASSDVTAALRRTHNLMSAELERSQFAREILENSTKDLNTLSESYTSLDTLLSSSRSLVSTLLHSQKSDTWYLESAFFILCVTIGWLVFRRLIYGPGWWILYFPLRLLWRFSLFIVQLLVGSLSAVAAAAGAKGQTKAVEQANGRIDASLSHTPTARGKAGIPTFERNMPAPSVKVGAGGHGAKVEHPKSREQSMSEQVGGMAERAQQEGKDHTQERPETVLRERREDERPNPKKRMWEEPVEELAKAQGNTPRDEL